MSTMDALTVYLPPNIASGLCCQSQKIILVLLKIILTSILQIFSDASKKMGFFRQIALKCIPIDPFN